MKQGVESLHEENRSAATEWHSSTKKLLFDYMVHNSAQVCMATLRAELDLQPGSVGAMLNLDSEKREEF